MVISLLLAAQAAAAQPDVADSADIVVTASRLGERRGDSAVSVTVIDEERIERLGEPLVHSLARLTPSASVDVSGPAGSLTQVRIRGSEANHSLLFIDGIRANDPAAGGTPRFELLNADIASRVEIVRGPQSALWGSEAIGGVIALNGADRDEQGLTATGELGSFGFARASGSAAARAGNAGLAAAAGWQRSDGIDSFSGEGDRDGYRNFAARARGTVELSPSIQLGASGFLLTGRTEFDGYNPVTFRRDDTFDTSRNRLAAGRIWADVGKGNARRFTLATSLLGSSNRNFLDSEPINRTKGRRWTAEAQLRHEFTTGPIAHRAVVALDHDQERFEANDTIYGGATAQERDRTHDAITGEWRAELAPFVASVALRHDRFSKFKDATSLRASGLVRLGGGFSATASHSEGIAQPTFFDLYGFFPGNFVGNPSLKPESSRGIEASLRYRAGPFEAAVTGYRQRLHDEIIDVFDPNTFMMTTANRDSASRRSGIEIEGSWRLGEQLRFTGHYAFLKASEPAGTDQVRESRRPNHSAAIALDGTSRRWTYGGSLALTGKRFDTDFDVWPAERVTLGAYWLAGARVAYAVSDNIELFARGSNLLDERYQDAVGYRTEGRALFAGVRLRR